MKVNYWLNKLITYTESWKHTLFIGGIVGVTLSAILIILQPFDTYAHQSPYKNLELMGYALLVLLVILLLHLFENRLFRAQKRQWPIWCEAVVIIIGSLLLLWSCYIYNARVINDEPIRLQYWWEWTMAFGGKFLIFFIPFWIFLRTRFGIIHEQAPIGIPITIIGQNKSEQLHINVQDFVYAQSQQNYADIYFKKEGSDQLEKKILRITLAQLQEQLPSAQQVHRSYLVNLAEAEKIQGNARKRLLILKNAPESIPLSPKYYEMVKKQLSDSSQ